MTNKDHSSAFDNRIGNMRPVKMETDYELTSHELRLLESTFYERPADVFRLTT